MSFSSREKVLNYMCKILSSFKVPDIKELIPEYFEISASTVEEGVKKRKLTLNKKNIAQVLIMEVIKSKWDVKNILTVAFDLELEYVIKYSNRFIWYANKFTGNSNKEEISQFADLIRATIRNDKKDASVSVKKVDNFFWISIVMKDSKRIGIFEKPCFVALSSDGRYFFIKDNRASGVIKYLTTSLGYKDEKKLKLSGKSLSSLLKLLVRKEKADFKNRPTYDVGEAVENDFGTDFTQKKSYLDFFDKCVDYETDINLQNYTVFASNTPWLGDDSPCLQQMEFKSKVTFSGDVARIIKQLPVASIVKPPFPSYLTNFSITGRNFVTLKSSVV